MPHFAALVARHHNRWNGSDLDMSEVDNIEDVAELVRDSIPDDADPSLVFVEENDEWFAIVRVDLLGDARVFMSDIRAVATSELAALLFQDQIPEGDPDDDLGIEDAVLDDDADAESVDEEEEEPVLRPDAEVGGSTDILADLGLGSAQLLELCAEEGMLPADVISAICETLGCADTIEVYR